MTDFVLEQCENNKSCVQFENVCYNYANFLKQPLKLEMFVPCDEYGILMEKPKISCATCKKCTCTNDYMKLYDKAKEKVLFEGFENYDKIWIERLIEDEAVESGLELNGTIKLTQNAIKQLGL